jgi:transcriptional regulator with XRE-family HTH domain
LTSRHDTHYITRINKKNLVHRTFHGDVRRSAMENNSWRERLQAAVDASGRSMREISMSSGMSENYLRTILANDREPGIDNLIAICQTLGVSSGYIILGYEVSGEAEALLRDFIKLSPRQRRAIMETAKSFKEE